jgi:ECF sigma factor
MQQPVTQLLAQWRDGDERAFAQLSALMYEELRQLAQRHLRRERSNHTIQKTALVNEAFVRLVGQQSVDWQSSCDACSSTMRGHGSRTSVAAVSAC